MMPQGAAEIRGRQQAALAGVVHDKSTSPELGELLAKCETIAAELGPYEAWIFLDFMFCFFFFFWRRGGRRDLELLGTAGTPSYCHKPFVMGVLLSRNPNPEPRINNRTTM